MRTNARKQLNARRHSRHARHLSGEESSYLQVALFIHRGFGRHGANVVEENILKNPGVNLRVFYVLIFTE